MASQKVNDANRRNSAKSTGPRTAAGKAASRNNAYRHGMRSRSVVIPGEDRAAYERLLAEMKAEHQPNTKHELFLVRQMTDAQWRLERLKGIEAALFDVPVVDPAEIERVSVWQIRMERSYFRAHKELKSFHKDAKAEAAAEARANTKAEEAAKSEDAKKPEPRKPVLYWTDLETGEPVLAPGFTEDGPIDYRKPENRGPDYGK